MSVETELPVPQILFDSGLRQDFDHIDVDHQRIGGLMLDIGIPEDYVKSTVIKFSSELPLVLSVSDAYGYYNPKTQLICVNAARIAVDNNDDDQCADILVSTLAHEIGHKYDHIFGLNRNKSKSKISDVSEKIAKAGFGVLAAAAGYKLALDNSSIVMLASGVGYLSPEITIANNTYAAHDRIKSQLPTSITGFYTDFVTQFVEERMISEHYRSSPSERSAMGFERAAKLILKDSITVQRGEDQKHMHDSYGRTNRMADRFDAYWNLISSSVVR